MEDINRRHRIQIGLNIDFSVVSKLKNVINIVEVIWYYNNIPEKQYEIRRYYFSTFKKFEDWYVLYKKAPQASPAAEYAIRKIPKYLTNLDTILEIYQIEYNDEVLREIAWTNLLKIAPNEFKSWRDIFDNSYHDERLNKYSFKKMVLLAQSKDDWFDFYERSPHGSRAQLIAIEHLYGKIKKRTYNEELGVSASKTSHEVKSPQKLKEKYEKMTFFSKPQINTVVDLYLVADSMVANKNDH